MTVLVNSKPQQLDDGATVAALVETLGLSLQRVAIEVNLELVTHTRWADFKLNEGDRVEIVSFVGGG
ncbi:MAG TPA: sulfur carrier protein ThiS [Planctomycetota bacterium]